MDKNTQWITRTAVFTALLIVSQFVTSQLGNQFITGSVNNLILIISTMICGFASGATVACISPAFARLLGIGTPFWLLVPFIAIGNLVLITLWYLIGKHVKNKKISYLLALIIAALSKFAALYIGIVMFAAPVLLNLPPNSPIMIAFSFPQLITAAIGGAIAVCILPLLKKAIKNLN